MGGRWGNQYSTYMYNKYLSNKPQDYTNNWITALITVCAWSPYRFSQERVEMQSVYECEGCPNGDPLPRMYAGIDDHDWSVRFDHHADSPMKIDTNKRLVTSLDNFRD